MVQVSVKYTGELHCDATHGPSRAKISTDAPSDNKGKGEAFSPTDMVATSLATCMLTIMGIMARNKEVNIQGATAEITKVMGTEPRRIIRIEIKFNMPKVGIDEHTQELLQRAAKTCPVAKSIHPDIEQVVEFFW